MKLAHARPLPDREGEIIPMSRKSLGCAAAFCLLVAAAAGAVAWAWWAEWAIHLLDWEVRLGSTPGVLGPVFLGGCPIAAGYLLYKMAFPSRLILGRDYFQWLVSGDRVWVQIPYRAITQMELTTDPSGLKIIGINLYREGDPKLWYREWNPQREGDGWDLSIEQGLWALPVVEIYARLSRHTSAAGGISTDCSSARPVE